MSENENMPINVVYHETQVNIPSSDSPEVVLENVINALRNPLNSIDASIELLSLVQDDSDWLEITRPQSLRALKGSVNKMRLIVNAAKKYLEEKR